MESDINELKKLLRALVVSSATQVDVRSLLRDYRMMVGAPLPITKYGYRDPVDFLRERFDDCFLLQGTHSNPVLTLIVPDTLKHIDKFVQKQKVSSNVKFKGKRTSVPETRVKPTGQSLIVETFKPKENKIKIYTSSNSKPVLNDQNDVIKENNNPETNNNEVRSDNKVCEVNNDAVSGQDSNCSRSALARFMKKRLPASSSTHSLENGDTYKDTEGPSSKGDDDSEPQTLSSSSSSKQRFMEELKKEIDDLLADYPEGVWCTDLMKLYRQRYGRSLCYRAVGCSSVLSLAVSLSARAELRGSGWLLSSARAAPPPASASASAPAAPAPAAPPPARRPPPAARQHIDPEDALPGIAFDADVFPADCVHLLESVPALGLAGLRPGAMLEVIVAEVYSPSHFWLIRLGEHYNIAMEEIMDQMTQYYGAGEGAARRLARGAVCVGHTCCALFAGDWHRAIIVKILDTDTVKVRHIDYGTVDTVPVWQLKPLRREWARLPAQAQRARLAAVRPAAQASVWPHAAAAAFLRSVSDLRLVANIVAIDHDEDILEVLLIDTSSEEDVCMSEQLVSGGHAEPRYDSALGAAEDYLLPRFAALEAAATPNYAEIRNYLRDGIALEFVEDYRRHVPLPVAPRPRAGPPPPSSSPSPPPSLSPPPPSLSPPPPSPPAPRPRAPWRTPYTPPSPQLPPAPRPLPPPPPPPASQPPGLSYPSYPGYAPLQAAASPTITLTLTAAEADEYSALSRQDPAAANWYMQRALERARGRTITDPYHANPLHTSPYQPNPTQIKPYQLNPTQTNPYQPNPTQINPYQPNPTQTSPYQPIPPPNSVHQPPYSVHQAPCSTHQTQYNGYQPNNIVHQPPYGAIQSLHNCRLPPGFEEHSTSQS